MNQASIHPSLPTTALWRPWLAAAALLVLVAVVYWPTLRNGYIWDDEIHIRDNPVLRSWQGLWAIWFQIGAVDQYYPLTYTTLWADYHLWGLDWSCFHAVNLALHAGSVLLFWRLLVRLAVPGAWLAAAIFAVHPVGVETVAWVSERKNLLSGLLALASIWAYLRFASPEAVTDSTPKPARAAWTNYLLALLLFIGALLAKSVTVTVPAVLLVITWWKRGRITWRDLTPLVPFFAIGIALCLVTIRLENSQGHTSDVVDLSFLARSLLAGRALCFYVGKIIWPHPLILFYPRWTIDTRAAWQYLFPAAVLAVIAGLWLARRRLGRGPLAGALIFAGVLAPGLGFFNIYMFRITFVADHFQYHAMMVLIALWAAACAFILHGNGSSAQWRLPMAGAMILLPLALISHRRTDVYQDRITLSEDLLRHDPTSWVAHYSLGFCYQETGQYDLAIEHFRQSIMTRERMVRDNPSVPAYREDLSWCYVDLAGAQETLGLLSDAERSYRESLRIRQELVAAEPTQLRYQNQVATSYVDLGLLERTAARPADAERSLREALEISQRLARENPGDDVFRDGLGWCYVDLALLAQDTGRGQEAWNLDQQAIAVRKELADAHPANAKYANQLATSYADRGLLERALGRLDEARKSLAEAIAIRQRLVPEEPTVTAYRVGLAAAHEDLASICRAAGDLAEAGDAYRHAIQERERLVLENPAESGYQDQVAASYVDLGWVQCERKEIQDAQQSFTRAVTLRRQLVKEYPQTLAYRDGLAWCYQHLADAQRQAGQLPEALASYRLALAQRQTLAQSEPANADYRARLEAVQASCDEVQQALKAHEQAE